MTQLSRIPSETLHSLLQYERSAVDTYDQVVARISPSRGADIGALHAIARQHRLHARLLEIQVLAEGGSPDTPMVAWSAYPRPIESTSPFFRDAAILRDLKQAEEETLRAYQSAIDLGELSAMAQDLITNRIFPGQELHVAALRQLLDQLRG